MLTSAVSQVLENAVKFSRQNAVIEVRSAREGEHVSVTISDECGGLPADIRDDLYMPYFVEGAAGDTPRLGLALVQHAMRVHGGEVGVKNRVGHGCTFQLKLPASQPS